MVWPESEKSKETLHKLGTSESCGHAVVRVWVRDLNSVSLHLTFRTLINVCLTIVNESTSGQLEMSNKQRLVS